MRCLNRLGCVEDAKTEKPRAVLSEVVVRRAVDKDTVA